MHTVGSKRVQSHLQLKRSKAITNVAGSHSMILTYTLAEIAMEGKFGYSLSMILKYW